MTSRTLKASAKQKTKMLPCKCVMRKTLIGYKIEWGFLYHTEYMGPARPKRSDHPFYPMKEAKNWKKTGI